MTTLEKKISSKEVRWEIDTTDQTRWKMAAQTVAAVELRGKEHTMRHNEKWHPKSLLYVGYCAGDTQRETDDLLNQRR